MPLLINYWVWNRLLPLHCLRYLNFLKWLKILPLWIWYLRLLPYTRGVNVRLWVIYKLILHNMIWFDRNVWLLMLKLPFGILPAHKADMPNGLRFLGLAPAFGIAWIILLLNNVFKRSCLSLHWVGDISMPNRTLTPALCVPEVPLLFYTYLPGVLPLDLYVIA